MKTADNKPMCCIPAAQKHSSNQPKLNEQLTFEQNNESVHSNMVALPGGTFYMGADDGPHREDGEGPVRQVTLSPFSLSISSVTNDEFAGFADATGYTTTAERDGSSFVFHLLLHDSDLTSPVAAQATWWHHVDGACWRWPEGPAGVSAAERADHPTTHISLADALAYCHWSQTRLPTEAEWEYAARGGLERKAFPWGDLLEQDGQHHSNVWQGVFPTNNSAEDGYRGTAPALCYQPNGYGLYNMTGNVWEWTADRFTNLHSPRPVSNKTGPLNGSRFVAKGGSYLCHACYCMRYRTSSRQALDPNTTAGNIGFRVALN